MEDGGLNREPTQLELIGDILWQGTKEEIEAQGQLHSGFLKYEYSDVGKGYFTIWYYDEEQRAYGLPSIPNCVQFFGRRHSF